MTSVYSEQNPFPLPYDLGDASIVTDLLICCPPGSHNAPLGQAPMITSRQWKLGVSLPSFCFLGWTGRGPALFLNSSIHKCRPLVSQQMMDQGKRVSEKITTSQDRRASTSPRAVRASPRAQRGRRRIKRWDAQCQAWDGYVGSWGGGGGHRRSEDLSQARWRGREKRPPCT